MSLSAASATLAQVSRSLHDRASQTESDGEVLARFTRTRDEDAFETLVRRLGPMVLGVCRRFIGDSHLAEDAFQAVFLVLARRASDVRPWEGVRGWVYGVAVRTAKEARVMAARRRVREVGCALVPDCPAPPEDERDAEAMALIDEEIARLPEHLRIAVVLCEIEGHSRKEVAGRLRIAEGTLSSRLAAARKRLARRLRQRGLAISAAAVAAAMTRPASAHLPSALAAKAVQAVTRGHISPPVAALSQGVFRLMFLNKLKTGVSLVFAAAVLLAGAAVIAKPTETPPAVSAVPKTPPIVTVKHSEPTTKTGAKSPPKGPNKLLFYRSGYLILMDPDGKNETKATEDRDTFFPGFYSRLSPDGKMVAFLVQVMKPGTAGGENGRDPQRKLCIREIAGKEPGIDMDITCQLCSWSPDGTQLATTDFVDGPPGMPINAVHHVISVKTKEKKTLKLPDNHAITDWTRDGKYFLTTSIAVTDGKPAARLHLMNPDGTEHKLLTNGKEMVAFGRISPDGARVLYQVVSPPKEKESSLRRTLAVLEIASGKETPLTDLPLNGDVSGYCWSPDGKRIAYSWRELHEGKPEDIVKKEAESHVVVCDPDGKNQKTIATEKGDGQWTITIGDVDWR